MNKTIQTLIATVVAAVVALASFTQLCLALASTNPVTQPQGEETQQADAQNAIDGEGQAEDAEATEESTSRDQFVATWAERIDAFNEGYPLAGYGDVFAEAAYDNHVDPRLSPAIARAESESGRVCFRAYNAWGWGDEEWSNWTDAIHAHVQGLAENYGYDITEESASRYADGESDVWFEQVESFKYEIWESDAL